LPLRELLHDLLEHLGRIILPALLRAAALAALGGGIVVAMVMMVVMVMVAMDAVAALIIEDIAQTGHS
jgi:hypothetical protein